MATAEQMVSRTLETAAADPWPTRSLQPISGRQAGARAVTIQPGLSTLRNLLGRRPADIATRAIERWTIAPEGCVNVRPAKFLDGQLERIRGTEFGTFEDVIRDFRGGYDSPQLPTLGFRLKNVMLIDGVLYSANTVRHLRRRLSRSPAASIPREHTTGSLYESWPGNRWFGVWLSDDCLTYPLAANHGPVLSSWSDEPSRHRASYELLLDMCPRKMRSAWFDELILFDDASHNEFKRERADRLRQQLVGDTVQSHPGVFLLRGSSGDPRLLVNEREIAERLATKRGFRILDASHASLDQIIADCSGAAVVAGVEGSQLVHGQILMPPGACLLTIQPPGRVVSVMKLVTDRQGQDFSLVVGVGPDERFWADPDEVERTLDLV